MKIETDKGTIEIYSGSEGLCYMGVCAPEALTTQEIEEAVITNSPAGTRNNWKLADEDFRGGQKNGCVCNKDPKRRHYLLSC